MTLFTFHRLQATFQQIKPTFLTLFPLWKSFHSMRIVSNVMSTINSSPSACPFLAAQKFLIAFLLYFCCDTHCFFFFFLIIIICVLELSASAAIQDSSRPNPCLLTQELWVGSNCLLARINEIPLHMCKHLLIRVNFFSFLVASRTEVPNWQLEAESGPQMCFVESTVIFLIESTFFNGTF